MQLQQKTVQQYIKETFALIKRNVSNRDSTKILTVTDAIEAYADEQSDDNLFALIEACATKIGKKQSETELEVLNRVELIVLQKNLDYGSSFLVPLAFLPKEKPELTILVRLSDKAERYKNLINQSCVVNVVDETIEDTLQDMIGYCVLLVVARKFQRNT